jgi:hypothetical protein
MCHREVHYRVHNSPPLILILRQMNALHTSYALFKIHFNIIFPVVCPSPVAQ